MNPEEASGWALIKELKVKNADMQWLQTMLYMICPDHYFFDPAYSRLNKKDNRKNPIMDEDDQFSIYKSAFEGMVPPRPNKRAYVASQIFRPKKPTKTERM